MQQENKRPLEPFELFGVECGKGWNDLLKPVFDYINEYNKDKTEEEQLKPLQIKEKWSELRIYMNFLTEELDKIIDKAVEESHHTCEICGSKEDIGTTYEGWYMKKCHRCMKEHVIRNCRPHRWKRDSDNKIYWVYPDRDDEEYVPESKK